MEDPSLTAGLAEALLDDEKRSLAVLSDYLRERGVPLPPGATTAQVLRAVVGWPGWPAIAHQRVGCAIAVRLLPLLGDSRAAEHSVRALRAKELQLAGEDPGAALPRARDRIGYALDRRANIVTLVVRAVSNPDLESASARAAAARAAVRGARAAGVPDAELLSIAIRALDP